MSNNNFGFYPILEPDSDEELERLEALMPGRSLPKRPIRSKRPPPAPPKPTYWELKGQHRKKLLSEFEREAKEAESLESVIFHVNEYNAKFKKARDEEMLRDGTPNDTGT